MTDRQLAALDRVAAALERIAAGIERLVPPVPPAPEPAPCIRCGGQGWLGSQLMLCHACAGSGRAT